MQHLRERQVIRKGVTTGAAGGTGFGGTAMGTMPYGPTRPRHIHDLDNQFGGDPEQYMAAYEAALVNLRSDRSIAELAGARVSAEDAEHFTQHWLDQWWPQHQPVEPVLRAGLIEAIEQAKEARLPLQTIFVGGADETFEIAVVRSEHQITMLVVTPPSPGSEAPHHRGVTVIRRQGGQIRVHRPASD